MKISTMDIIDIFLDLIIGATAWFYGAWSVFHGNTEIGIISFILSFVVEQVLASKLVRKGLLPVKK